LLTPVVSSSIIIMQELNNSIAVQPSLQKLKENLEIKTYAFNEAIKNGACFDTLKQIKEDINKVSNEIYIIELQLPAVKTENRHSH